MDSERMNSEYPGLSTVSVVLKVIGVLVLIIAAILLILGIVMLTDYNRGNEGLYLIALSILSVFLYSVPYFAFAELIKLFVRIEFNTRKDHHSERFNQYDSQSSKPRSASPMKNDVSYEEWKKDNPSKTINDYYAAMRK